MIDLNNFLSFQVHGTAGGHNSGGVASFVQDILTFLESLVGLSPSEMLMTILPGALNMANIHPLVVHFPIAFLTVFFLMDLLGSIFNWDSWRRLATGLLYIGTIAAAATVAAGLSAEGSIEHGANVHQIMERHEIIGISILCLSVLLSIWRLLTSGMIHGVSNMIFILFAAILTILIMLGADLGGMMVYKYGVAVEAVEVESIDYFQEHTHSH